MSEIVRMSRESLYERVWEQPLSRLATEYGTSDVGLRKVLDRFEIPRPPAGYWAMKTERQIPAKRVMGSPSDPRLEEVWFTSHGSDQPPIELPMDHPARERAQAFPFNNEQRLITWLPFHRFGSQSGCGPLNPHFRMLYLNGVYDRNAAQPKPTSGQSNRLLVRIWMSLPT